ncbi:hypothetical protein KAI87_11650, partial [Myxococcota bacterium]|nr:hypothetical protein [Myxococcota bacterium]
PDSLYGVCNYTGEIPDDVYVDILTQCPEYNQPIQIVQKVQDIIALGNRYGAGDIKMHSVFLFAPDEVVASVCGDVSVFGYVREEAEPLLRSMAEEGGGTYRDVNISTEIDFLDFDYESLQAPYDLVEFFAININTLPGKDGVLTDSDRDGVDDELEFERGLQRLVPDSDHDGFSDLFELRFETRGFDSLDANIPAIGCSDTQDRDGDGLVGCEEIFLESDPLQPDTDGDRIPDGIEFRLGTDPTVHDTATDHDLDGRLSGYEIRTGTDPSQLEGDQILFRQIQYGVTMGPLQADDVRCYDFSINGIRLVPTLAEPSQLQSSGTNRILVFAQEAPTGMGGTRGRHYVACIEARYLGDTFKDPISGEIPGFSPERFVEIQIFDPALHCLHPGEDPTAPLQ